VRKEGIMARSGFDLEDRLLGYAARIIKLVDRLPSTRANNHVAKQVLRSGTSPLPNHGEAQSAESRADFVHKLQICLKEFRETKRWLKLILLARMAREPKDVEDLLAETEELIRIFAASINTARKKDDAWIP
jgi:four helix bundle protein